MSTDLLLYAGIRIPEDDPMRKLIEICVGLGYINPYRAYFARFQNKKADGSNRRTVFRLQESLPNSKRFLFKNIFIDGTKTEANAKRCTLVRMKAVEKNMEKLKEKIAKEYPKIGVRYGLAMERNKQILEN